jgi:hypothetical protein
MTLKGLHLLLTIGLLVALSLGLVIFGCSAFVFQNGLSEGLSLGLRATESVLILGLFIILNGALVASSLEGFGERQTEGASPNQGIDNSRINSLTVILVVVPALGLANLLLGWLLSVTFEMQTGWSPIYNLEHPDRMPPVLRQIAFFSLLCGLIAWFYRGGAAVIKHYELRLILFLKGRTPFQFIGLLDHCANLIFLKKVGGGYIFIHRMLLDYFAERGRVRDPQAATKEARTTLARKKVRTRLTVVFVSVILSSLIFILYHSNFSPKKALELVKNLMGEAGAKFAPVVAALLKDPDSNVRWRAAQALGQMDIAGAKFAPEVAALLKDRDFNVRWGAATALGQMGEAGAKFVPEVAALLKDPNFDVRRAAVTALGQMREADAKVAPEVAALLKDPDSDFRSAQALGQMRVAAAKGVAEMVALLKDADSNVRWRAAQALGQMSETGAKIVPEVAALLKDPTFALRWNAATALGQMGEEHAKVVA